MSTTFAKYARSGAYHWQQVDASWRNPHYNPLLQARYRAVAELTPRHARKVLDIGCGDGCLLHRVHQQCVHQRWVHQQSFHPKCPEIELHGIEPEAEGLAFAREQLQRRGCRAELREGSAYGLPFDDCCFDAVYLADVIEHLEDYHQAVREAHRVLRIGGAFLVSTPNRQPDGKWDRLHVHEFDAGELQKLLGEFFGEVTVWTAWPMNWVHRWKSGRIWRKSINATCRLGWNPFRRLHAEQSVRYGQLVARAMK